MTRPRAIHVSQPDVVAAIRDDLADWRKWMARFVVMAYAALAGLSVVAFTWLSDQALHAFVWLRGVNPLLPFVWTPLCTAALAWLTIRFAPGAAGSGIPQVMAALDPAVSDANRPLFVSLRLSLAKIGLT